MTKIMLVEDDNNLREIYEARLLAEGYEIVSAKDGEEALAMAVKEKPDLIISDIMMPKISGFDMLDILRSTPETTDTKVIMMTALSQNEDKARAGKLGADRYLVKSQVTLEDVAKVAREVLSGEETPPASRQSSTGQDEPPAPATPPTTPTPAPVTPATGPQPTANDPVSPATPDPISTGQTSQATTTDSATTIPVTTDTTDSASSSTTDSSTPDLKSTATDNVTPQAGSTQIDPTLAATLQAEEAAVESKINQFSTGEGESKDNAASSPIQIDVKDEISKETPPTDSKSSESTPEHKLVGALKDLSKQEEASVPTSDVDTTEKPEEDTSENVPIAHKKVIEPINDMSQTAPNLKELLAKEDMKSADSPVVAPDPSLPVQSVIKPGNVDTPSTNTSDSAPSQPGNVITPGGGSISSPAMGAQKPSDIAL